VEISIEI